MIAGGASLMIGGVMAVGTPERMIDAIVARGTRSLARLLKTEVVTGAQVADGLARLPPDAVRLIRSTAEGARAARTGPILPPEAQGSRRSR